MLLNNIVFVLSMLIVSGCTDCNYIIQSEQIKSSCYIDEGFSLNELKVYSLNGSNVPDSYNVVKEFILILNNKKMHKKIIYFNKENEGYDWFYVQEMKSTAVLPITIEKNKWYQIRSLVFRGHPDRAAFIMLQDNGKVKVHGYSESLFY